MNLVVGQKSIWYERVNPAVKRLLDGMINDGYWKNVNLPVFLVVIGAHAHLVWFKNLLCYEF